MLNQSPLVDVRAERGIFRMQASVYSSNTLRGKKDFDIPLRIDGERDPTCLVLKS